MMSEEGVRGFYSGFTANLIRCVPMVIVQYMMFQSFRFITKQKREDLSRIPKVEKSKAKE